MRNHTWTCDECGRQIENDAGVFVVYNSNQEHGRVGSYPHVPSADLDAAFERELIEERREKGEDAPGFVDLMEVGPAMAAAYEANPLNVGMKVCHHDCFPWSDDEVAPYLIQLRELRDGDDVVEWALHLAEKTWMGKRDLLNFLRRYAGRAVDSP